MIKTRFAPSPTGYLHFGSLKAVLFPFLHAKKYNGTFILRIDNTDRERSTIEYENAILKDLEWLGINYEYKIKQSERIDKYDHYFELLKKKGMIYACSETPEQLDRFRIIKRAKKEAPIFIKKDCKLDESLPIYWRFDIQNERFTIHDLIMGEINLTREWSDPIIKKSNGDYSYTFASVVDDIEENISHIIRGNEHISGAVIQKQIGNAILDSEWPIEFCHFPLFLDQIGNKLSKRNLDTNMSDLKVFEPWTFISILTNLGTGHKQIFSNKWQDYIDLFDLRFFSKNMQKFDYNFISMTNKKILKFLSDDEVLRRKANLKIWKLLKNNISTWNNFQIKSEQLINFDIHNSIYKDLMNNISIEDFAIKNNKTTKEVMIELYQNIFNEPSGPKIKDLIQFKLNQ